MSILDALKMNVVDILIKAAINMTHFGPNFISKEIGFMTLIDSYKNMECSLIKVLGSKVVNLPMIEPPKCL